MKIRVIFLSLLTSLWMACEDEIDVDLEESEPLMVVDAWINDKPEDQIILLSWTQSYFSDDIPSPVTGAAVSISDSEGLEFEFAERSDGEYVWSPSSAFPSFGKTGNEYTLNIQVREGERYEAVSVMNRVTAVDSITFTFEEETIFLPDSYIGEFWAKDLEGPGDTYWIRAYKNGIFLNMPSDINIAYDAGISEGDFDGLTFLGPIREGINPQEEDEDGENLSPYEPGDSVYVEIHSITHEAFDYLNEVSIQTDRPGGFAELFSDPLANVSTNIVHVGEEDRRAVGFFNVAAVRGNGKRLELE